MSDAAVEYTRNGIIESIHRAIICVTDCNGRILYSFGNPDHITFFRSSAKPIILISNMQKGIVEKFGFSHQEISIMASSNSGGKKHVMVLEKIAGKIRIEEKQLQCGIRRPFGDKEYLELLESGGRISKFHNNCAGKHLSIISACLAVDYDWEGYYEKDHPIQKDIIKTISEFSRFPEGKILTGVDGCGVPVYAMPIKNIACSYANLFNTGFMNGVYRKSQKLLYESVREHPDMIASEERIDTRILRITNGAVFGKMGAEGVFCVNIKDENIGITIKIEDGNIRAVDPVACEVLYQIGIVSKKELNKLEDLWHPVIYTYSGSKAGRMYPVFKLEKHY